MKEQYLTQEGLNELKARLQDLKTVRRREIAEAIHTAKEQGDLSENAEYASAKEEQRRIEIEISQLETTIKNSRLIKESTSDEVSIGNTVKLNCGGEERIYRIVGASEANPLEGKISNESPMGQALLNKKKGEKVHIPTPSGNKECEVIDIV